MRKKNIKKRSNTEFKKLKHIRKKGNLFLEVYSRQHERQLVRTMSRKTFETSL